VDGQNKSTRSIIVFILCCLVSAGTAGAGTSWLQEAELTADDGAAGDLFGCSVSISGDYAIIGAEKDKCEGRKSGSAYIFGRDGAGWIQQQKLIASDGIAKDRFGGSVSISGGFAIIGASGSAYIFGWDGSGWVQQQKLTASSPDTSDSLSCASSCAAVDGGFGCSVSISGDYAIVGAEKDKCKGQSSGSAYIFRRDGTGWVQQQKLTASNPDASDLRPDSHICKRFGCSVSISGDYAIIGASGSAYIFRRDGTGWVQQQKLTASSPDTSDSLSCTSSCTTVDGGFGCSVSISGDYAIVGAEKDKCEGRKSGSAYIFRRDGTGWVQQQKLTASDGAAKNRFGSSVSISGGFAIIGASGSAYIFGRDGAGWVHQQKLTASNPDTSDSLSCASSCATADEWFGCSVSISGDYAIVGAEKDKCRGRKSGSAYIFGADVIGELTLLAPNGGKNLVAGSTYDITWDANGFVENVFIEYSGDNGANWTAVDTVANTGSYSWLVPNVNSDECLVYISDADYPTTGDISDDVFRIYVCTLAYDLNHDCFVDFFDFSLLASEWLQCGDPCDPDCW